MTTGQGPNKPSSGNPVAIFGEEFFSGHCLVWNTVLVIFVFSITSYAFIGGCESDKTVRNGAEVVCVRNFLLSVRLANQSLRKSKRE